MFHFVFMEAPSVVSRQNGCSFVHYNFVVTIGDGGGV